MPLVPRLLSTNEIWEDVSMIRSIDKQSRRLLRQPSIDWTDVTAVITTSSGDYERHLYQALRTSCTVHIHMWQCLGLNGG